MRTYFERWSVRAAFLGLLIAVLAFIPAVLPLLHWEPPKWYEVIGGIIAILALWISFVLATFFQQVEVEEEIKRLSDVSPSSEAIEYAPHCLTLLRDLSQELKHLAKNHKNNKRLTEQAELILGDALQDFRRLVNGRFETQFWRCKILREEVNNMERELIGYSPLSSEEETAWWESGEGALFFEANKRVLEKGRQIVRIFCCNPNDPKVARILDSHSDINVQVYVISIEDAKAVLRNEFDESMAVVDERISYRSKKGKEWEGARNVWSCIQEDIKKQLEVLRYLQGHKAREYKPAGARNAQA